MGQQQKSNSTASKVKSRMAGAVNLFNSWGNDGKPMKRGSFASKVDESEEESSTTFNASLDGGEDDDSSIFVPLDEDELGLGDEVDGEEVAGH